MADTPFSGPAAGKWTESEVATFFATLDALAGQSPDKCFGLIAECIGTKDREQVRRPRAPGRHTGAARHTGTAARAVGA